MADDETRPVQNTAERFRKWLQLLEAHGAKRQRDLVPKARCVHGEVWDECGACAESAGGEGQA